METFDDIDLHLVHRFKDRTKGKALETRREREVRPVTHLDRIRTSTVQHKDTQLNMRVRREAFDRFMAHTRNSRLSRVDFLDVLLDVFEESLKGNKP